MAPAPGSITLFLALLLAGSALHKGLAHERLAIAAARLAGTRPSSGPLLLLTAGSVEAVAAACLLIAPLQRTGALIAAMLWLGYALALFRRRGETLDCGCDLVAREKPVTTAQVARPALLALAAGLVSTLPAAAFGIETPFAAAGLCALYLGVSELLAIPQPAWRKP